MSPDRFANLADVPRTENVAGRPRPPLDGRQARAWVQALPRANALVTMVRLREMLHGLLALRLESNRRLQILEEVRLPVLEVTAQLEREFVGAPVPLPPARVRAAQDAEAFHLHLAHGYRLAAAEICGPNGKPPMLRSRSVLTALQRSLFHHHHALIEAWRVYRQPAHSVWAGLHRTFWFAEQVGLADKSVDDPQHGALSTPRQIYVKTLLVALANPYSSSQAEQGDLCELGAAFADSCRLLRHRPDESAATVPDAADLPPGLDPGEHHGFWVDIKPLCLAIESALTQAGQTLTLSPSRGVRVRIGREALIRLQRALGQAAARDHQRLRANHRVEAVIGMSGLHYFLAGRLDFDAFVRRCGNQQIQIHDRAAWSQNIGEISRVPVLPARVVDQSLGGYCLRWQASTQVRARVGELIGLAFADDDDEDRRQWMIGVFRWLRYEDEGTVLAGVELLARSARAVGLRATGLDGRPRPALRAIEIDRLDGAGRRCFIASDIVDIADVRVEVIRAPNEDEWVDADPLAPSVEGLKALAQAGEYLLMCTTLNCDDPGQSHQAA